MGYRIVTYNGDIMEDGFKTATEAHVFMHTKWNKIFIQDMSLRIEKEEEDEVCNYIPDKEC